MIEVTKQEELASRLFETIIIGSLSSPMGMPTWDELPDEPIITEDGDLSHAILYCKNHYRDAAKFIKFYGQMPSS